MKKLLFGIAWMIGMGLTLYAQVTNGISRIDLLPDGVLYNSTYLLNFTDNDEKIEAVFGSASTKYSGQVSYDLYYYDKNIPLYSFSLNFENTRIMTFWLEKIESDVPIIIEDKELYFGMAMQDVMVMFKEYEVVRISEILDSKFKKYQIGYQVGDNYLVITADEKDGVITKVSYGDTKWWFLT